VLSDNAVGEREPYSMSGGFRGKERNENALKVRCGNSFPSIFDYNYGPMLSCAISFA